MIWAEWWFWGVVALGLGLLEMLAPAYAFLGFAVGAAAMAAVLVVGGPAAGWIAGSLPLTLLTFAAVSAAAWAGLRAALGAPGGSAERIERDVNDD